MGSYVDAQLSVCGGATGVPPQLLGQMDSLGAEVGVGGIIGFGLRLAHL